MVADESQVVSLGSVGRQMCEGEYESLKAIYTISPSFVPRPYAWGEIEENESTAHFLLTAFLDIEKQVWVLQLSRMSKC